jgi:hypothetical protein
MQRKLDQHQYQQQDASQPDLKRSRVTCDQCGRDYVQSFLPQHVADTHCEEEERTCTPGCGKTLTSRSSLLKHHLICAPYKAHTAAVLANHTERSIEIKLAAIASRLASAYEKPVADTFRSPLPILKGGASPLHDPLPADGGGQVQAFENSLTSDPLPGKDNNDDRGAAGSSGTQLRRGAHDQALYVIQAMKIRLRDILTGAAPSDVTALTVTVALLREQNVLDGVLGDAKECLFGDIRYFTSAYRMGLLARRLHWLARGPSLRPRASALQKVCVYVCV